MATNIFEMCFEAYNEISSFHIVFKLDVGDLKHNIRLHRQHRHIRVCVYYAEQTP